jgi:hypothetical protein
MGLSSSYETIGGPQGLSVDLNLIPEATEELKTVGAIRLTTGVLVEARRERCRAA